MNEHKTLSMNFVYILFLLVLFVVMNSTIFNVALPTIGQELDLGATSLSWIVTSYTLITAIGSIIYGKLSTYHSLRTLFFIGITFFVLGSLLGAFSQTLYLLIFSRIVQSIGGASFITLSFITVSSYFPKHLQGRAFGILNAGVVLGSGVGPLLGGIITDFLGWSYIFVFMVLTLAFLPFIRLIPSTRTSNESFDLFNIILVTITAVIALLSVNVSYYLIIIVPISCLITVKNLNRTPDPFINVTLFKKSEFKFLLFIGFVSYSSIVASFVLMPFYLRAIYQLQPLEIGIFMLVAACFSATASLIIGKRVQRDLIVPILALGSLMMVSGFLLIGLLQTSLIILLIFYILIYIGFSFIQVTSLFFISDIFKEEKSKSEAVSIFNFFSFLGMAFGPASYTKLFALLSSEKIIFLIIASISALNFLFIYMIISHQSDVKKVK
ncbi:MFS transporter [Exiguobacterium sp. s189]|uniref:MFS transporter n=1 Tax=Exiguobacterium sp. s189 TaxID=2751263 RepID=UPI001BEBC278|nr:MFS transporter [Exiguobacterium sp. s189]